jgi:hypothetical protein
MAPEPDGTNPDPTPAEGEDQTPDVASPIPLPRGINCCKCSYELHGLTRDARCPECATPIEDSLKSDALIFASPEFLRKLRIGAEMTTWGAFAWVFVAVFSWLIQSIMASVIKTLIRIPDADLVAGSIVYLLHFSTALVLVRGIWLLTIPDERPERVSEKKWVRPVARWVLLTSFGLQEFGLVLMLLASSFTTYFYTTTLFTLATNAVGWALLLRLVAGYYHRGRVYRLERWSKIAVGTAIAIPVLVLVFFVLTMAMPPLPGPIFFTAGFAIGLIPLVVLILLVFTLLVSFVVFVELGSWINKARIRSEAIRAAAGADAGLPF